MRPIVIAGTLSLLSFGIFARLTSLYFALIVTMPVNILLAGAIIALWRGDKRSARMMSVYVSATAIVTLGLITFHSTPFGRELMTNLTRAIFS